MTDRAAPELTIEPISTPTQEIRELIQELDGELGALYSSEQRHGLSLDAIFQPNILFFVARQDGVAVGGGGIALFSDFAEVKRMYVRKAVRGSGVADAILKNLIATARENGHAMLRLETGAYSLAAIRFYERAGFRRCAIFGAYSGMPADAVTTSLFLEMPL